MKKLLVLAILALPLSGCALFSELTGSSVSANDVYVAANAFDAAENSVKAYDSLPPCTSTAGSSIACRSSAVVKILDQAVRAGIPLRNQLLGYITANPGQVVPVANYQALMAVISSIQAALPATGG